MYLLQGNGDDIVVKQGDIKNVNATHFDLSKKAMGVVDQNVKASKKLVESELTALTNFVLHKKALVQWNLRDRVPGAVKNLDEALANLRDPAGEECMVKDAPHSTDEPAKRA